MAEYAEVSGAPVKPFGITLLAHRQRRGDKHLDETPVANDVACGLTRLMCGRNQGYDGMNLIGIEYAGDNACASVVLPAPGNPLNHQVSAVSVCSVWVTASIAEKVGTESAAR